MSSKNQAAPAPVGRQQQQNMMILAAIAVLAVIGAVVFVVLSANRPGGGVDVDKYTNIPQSRTEDGGFVLGSPDAPITIVEFADFQCPHCQDYTETIDRLIDDYVVTGKAKFEYRFFPVINQNSLYLAQLVECSETLKPGSFWVAHDTMFDMLSARQFSSNTPQEFADRMGLDYAPLLQCASKAKQVQTDTQVGRNIGVGGTPAVFVRVGDGDLQWVRPGGKAGDNAVLNFNELAAVIERVSG